MFSLAVIGPVGRPADDDARANSERLVVRSSHLQYFIFLTEWYLSARRRRLADGWVGGCRVFYFAQVDMRYVLLLLKTKPPHAVR